MFIEIKNPSSDITVLPIEVNWDFLALLRDGPLLKYGRTQEVKGEFLSNQVTVRECQHVARENSLNFDKSAKEDDDDFEEDDEDDEPQEKKLKVSGLAGVACSFIPKIQEEVGDRLQKILEEKLTWEEHGMILGFLAKYNEYYPMPEKWESQVERCTGIEYREPHHWFDGERLVFSYELNKKMIDMDGLCDGENMMRNVDPRYLYEENDPDRQKRVENDIVKFENFLDMLIDKDIWYIANKVGGTRFFDHFWMGRQFGSAAIYYFTSLHHMRDFCKQKYPVEGPWGNGTSLFYDHCALAHSNQPGNYNAVPHQIWWDFSDMGFSYDLRKNIDNLCDLIVFIAVILNLIGKNFSESLVLNVAFWGNLSLASIYLFEVTGDRYGIDYIAYI